MGGGVDFQKMHQRLSRAAGDFFYLPPPLPFHRRDKLRPRSSKSFTLDPPVTKTQGLGLWHLSPQSVTPPQGSNRSSHGEPKLHLRGFTPGLKTQMVRGQEATERSHWGLTARGSGDWNRLENRHPVKGAWHPPPASLHRKAAHLCWIVQSLKGRSL